MTHWRIALLVGVVVVLGSLIGYWFYTNFEKVSEEVDVGFKGEARTNPYLAAQRFFETYDIEVTTVEGLAQELPEAITFIVPTGRYEMGPKEAQRYLDWVERGGHLVVTAAQGYYYEGEKQDHLLEMVGLSLAENTLTRRAFSGMEEDEEDDTSDSITAEADLTQPVVHADWPGIPYLLTVDMNDYYRIDSGAAEHPVVLQLEDIIGAYLVRLRIGKGYLTVVYNSHFMTNQYIARHDHAAFLWQVATINTPRPVWLVYLDNMPSLAVWLARFAWTALLSFGVFLLVWLWYASRRFGPLLPPVVMARRRLLEHVEATGRYLWQRRHSQQLYKGVHTALQRTLEIRHPAWLSLSPNKLQQRLADISRLPLPQVQQAMNYVNTQNEHEFTKTIQTLEHIRKSL